MEIQNPENTYRAERRSLTPTAPVFELHSAEEEPYECRHFMNRLRKVLHILLLILALIICNCGGGGGGSPSGGGGTISLAWDATTTKTDGSPLADTDLAGYRVYYGTSPGTYTQSIYVGNVTSYTLTGLVPGQIYYITVAAIDTANPPDESAPSNEVSGAAK